MQLHLVVPGLLWPKRIHGETTRDLDLSVLPALGWLLGRGRLGWQEPTSLEDELVRSLSASAMLPGQAALRRLGEEPSFHTALIDRHHWLCADPVHLALEKRRLTLARHAHPASALELQEITQAIEPLLIEYAQTLGELHFIPGQNHGQAYLQLTRPAGLSNQPPSMLSGTDSLLLHGPQHRVWRQLQNEIQMRLHTLPLNARREALGQPVLNSLWLWGDGPKLAECPASQGRYTAIYGNHPLLPGLARWSESKECSLHNSPSLAAALEEAAHTRARTSLLWLESSLAETHRDYDLLNWQNQLIQLETHCFQPVQQALQKGLLHNLCIVMPGNETSLKIQVTPWTRRFFWRQPRRLSTLFADLSSSTNLRSSK